MASKNRRLYLSSLVTDTLRRNSQIYVNVVHIPAHRWRFGCLDRQFIDGSLASNLEINKKRKGSIEIFCNLTVFLVDFCCVYRIFFFNFSEFLSVSFLLLIFSSDRITNCQTVVIFQNKCRMVISPKQFFFLSNSEMVPGPQYANDATHIRRRQKLHNQIFCHSCNGIFIRRNISNQLAMHLSQK